MDHSRAVVQAAKLFACCDESLPTSEADRGMAAEVVPYGRVTQKKPAVDEIHIVWMTAGLG